MTKPETEWVLVPREPTREMWAASANALVKDRSWLNIAPDFVTEACYTAMLAASPPAPSVPDVVKLIEKLRDTDIDDFAIGPTMEAAAAALIAQAAEVERLTGEVKNLERARKHEFIVAEDHIQKLNSLTAPLREILGLIEEATPEQIVEHVANWKADALRLHREKMDALTRATTAESRLETARGALAPFAAFGEWAKSQGDREWLRVGSVRGTLKYSDLVRALAALPSPPITKIKGEG